MRSNSAQTDQQSLLLSEIVNRSIQCLRDEYDTPYVGLEVDNTIQVHEASSGLIRGFLADRYYQHYHEYPNKKLLESMADTIKSRCLVSSKIPVGYRVMSEAGAIYYDPGIDDWGSLKVTAAGYHYESPSPVYFRRTSGMGRLPLPIPDPYNRNVLEILQSVAPLPTMDHEILRLGFLLSCLWPNGPYPILNIYGPPESGKGFHSKVFRLLVDPVSAPLQGFPAHEQDLLLDACNQRLLVLDNISRLPNWGANALCRISTGASFRRRRMYTDADLLVFHVCGPTLINSVDQVVSAPDLVSRALFLELPPMPDAGRLDEQAMLAEVESQSSYILDGLLRIVTHAMANEPDIKEQSRITPTFRLMASAEQLLDLGTGAFSRAYYRNRSIGHDVILSEYAYIPAIRDLLAENGTWEGTIKELLTLLNTKVRAALRGDNWPNSAHSLARQLKGMTTSLHDVGFTIQLNIRETRLGQILKLSRRSQG